MANKKFVKKIEAKLSFKNDFEEVHVGDFIKIGMKIEDGAKKRIQFFNATVIAKKNTNSQSCLILRQLIQGIRVERILFLNSPLVSQIKILRAFKARQSKIYFYRNRSKKNTRLKQIII
uniref:Ribosomal protein L19 n=1 Tax=Verdigellas peltata TaxID=542676 RepID=A0A170TP10_9VIRI|nr:ribosomal protein L19 [Verdigellas peltata]CZF96670.1 ribosomal protein L19 [Verdigellas peltata]